jgi:hypothetical protein
VYQLALDTTTTATARQFPGLQSQAAAADAGARTVPARACNAMNGKSCTSIRVIGSSGLDCRNFAGKPRGMSCSLRSTVGDHDGSVCSPRGCREPTLPGSVGCQTSRGRTKLGTVGIMRHLLEPIGRRDKRQHEASGVRPVPRGLSLRLGQRKAA